MLGLTTLGTWHTAISLVAVAAGFFALVRDKEISWRNGVGKLYVVTTVISIEEQLSGWYGRVRRAKKRDELARAYLQFAKTTMFLSHFAVLPFPEPAINRYHDIDAKLNELNR